MYVSVNDGLDLILDSYFDLCTLVLIHTQNLMHASFCTEVVCFYIFSPEFVTLNGYNSQPGAYYNSSGSSGTKAF